MTKKQKVLALAESERKLGHTKAADNMEALAAQLTEKVEPQEFKKGDEVLAPRWYQIWPAKGSYRLCKAKVVSIGRGQRFGEWTMWCEVEWQDSTWPQIGPKHVPRSTVRLSEIQPR
jgi:hypothetical protein